MMTLHIYVPCHDSPLRRFIKKGSAIVGTGITNDVGLVQIDYEGNLYGAANLNLFRGRLQSAAGRCINGYPTMARMLVDPDELICIGNVPVGGKGSDYFGYIFIREAELFTEWVGEDLRHLNALRSALMPTMENRGLS